MKKSIIVILLLVIGVSLYLVFPSKNINYDMSLYLPDSSMTKMGEQILNDEFPTQSTIQLMIEDVDVSETLDLKNRLSEVDHVVQVVWLDDYVDLQTIPIEVVPNETRSLFYNDESALLTIILDYDIYSTNIDQTTTSIHSLLQGYNYHLRGDVLTNQEARNIAQSETFKIMYIIIPIIILILIFSSTSWIEPIIILLTLGIAILYNLVTNTFLPSVSFITQTMCLALQLALSIDYAIFMIHRYYEERETSDCNTSVKLAIKHSIKPITISALTTIAGFTALALMKYAIGLDISVVLLKGIIFSYLATILVMPMLLMMFDSLLQKTKHQNFFPKFSWLSKLQKKYKYFFLGLFIVLFISSFILQTKTEFIYGTTSNGDENSIVAEDNQSISRVFGENNQLVIVVPNTDNQTETLLVQDLMQNTDIISINALVTTVSPSIDRQYVPEDVLKQFVGEHYSRIILSTKIGEENEEMYQFISDLNTLMSQHYSEYYLVSQTSAIYDIKEAITSDSLLILLMTIALVGIIVGLIFKSYKIPIILLGVILSSIFINLGYLVIMQSKILYIGYLVVMSIQLGVTIDYAVLFTSRYIEERSTFSKNIAIYNATNKSVKSILVSGSILVFVGLIEGVFSRLDSITKIGMMIGRGSFLSLVMIILFLPVLLNILDRWIKPIKFSDKNDINDKNQIHNL